MGHLNRAPRAMPAPPELLEGAISPVFGIRWSSQIIRRLAPREINGISRLLRNAELSHLIHDRVSQLLEGCGPP